MSAAADPAEEKNAKDEVRWRFKPRQLDITWGGDSKYWKMPAEGTDGPAELLEVVWLEINGSTPKPLPKGKRYALSFKISMAHYDPVWRTYPVYMLAKVGKKGTSNWEKIYLEDKGVGDIIEFLLGSFGLKFLKRLKIPCSISDSMNCGVENGSKVYEFMRL